MNKFSQVRKKDILQSVLFISLYVILITITAIWLLVDYWYLWLAIVLGGMLLLVWWHKENTGYRCMHCGTEFEISFYVDLISPHGVTKEGGWLYLRCPECKKWGKATILRKEHE